MFRELFLHALDGLRGALLAIFDDWRLPLRRLLGDLVEHAGGGLELAHRALETSLLLEFFRLLHSHIGFHEDFAGIFLRASGERGDAETGD